MSIDLDEIRPDRFVIRNDKVRPLLRGEGVTTGKFFELVTWRREGLIARIRERGFNVRTIKDRIALLPAIDDVGPQGNIGVRILAQAKERIARFDPTTLHWHDLSTIEHNGQSAVQLRDNEPIRRRKGRGAGDYYITSMTPAGLVNFVPVTETTALLHAYAQLVASGQAPILRYTEHDETYLVPQQQALLPPQHRELLQMLALDKSTPWTFPKKVAALVENVFAKLGLVLQPSA